MKNFRPPWVSKAINFKRAAGDLDSTTLDDHFHADLLVVAFSGGQGSLERSLGYFHHVAKTDGPQPYPCVLWNSETGRPMTHAEISSEIGISAEKLGGKSRGVICTLETAKLIEVDRTDRDSLGRKIGEDIKLARGSLVAHLRRLRISGAHLSAKLCLLVVIQTAFDLDQGFAQVSLSELVKDVGVGEKALRALIRELIADGIIVAVGMNRLSFAAKVFCASAFEPYVGPIFGQDECPSNYKLESAKVQEAGIQAGSRQNTEGGRQSTTIYTDSYRDISSADSKAKKPEGALAASRSPSAAPLSTGLARAEEAPSGAAAGEREPSRPAKRKSFSEFQEQVVQTIAGRDLAVLSDDERYGLMADAVRGRMSERLIARNSDDGLALFRQLEAGWRTTDYRPELIFFEMFWKAEKAQSISVWRFIGLRIEDCIKRGQDEKAGWDAFLAASGGTTPQPTPPLAPIEPAAVPVEEMPHNEAEEAPLPLNKATEYLAEITAAMYDQSLDQHDVIEAIKAALCKHRGISPSQAPMNRGRRRHSPAAPSSGAREAAAGPDRLATELVSAFAGTPSVAAFEQVKQMLIPRLDRLGEQRVRQLLGPIVRKLGASEEVVRIRELGTLIDEAAHDL